MILEIDYRKPMDLIRHEVEAHIKKAQLVYGIRPQSSRYAGLFLTYIAFVGNKLGWTKFQISREQRATFPTNVGYIRDARPSNRKRAQRAREKADSLV
jgi:hypothetical protein